MSQLGHEGRISDLGGIASNHQITKPVDLRPFGDQDQIDAGHRCCRLQQVQIGGAYLASVIV
jgi:hypothetical protein